MTFISSEDEAILTFEGIVPEWRKSQVISLDVGSGIAVIDLAYYTRSITAILSY